MIANNHSVILAGKTIRLRDANVEDSEFILNLRTDPNKSKYINHTDNDLNKQIEFMKKYKKTDNEWYFIVENLDGMPIGTCSVHKQPELLDAWKNKNLGIGRWIMSNKATIKNSIESDYIIKKFAFETLYINPLPMIVHKENESVLKFHQKWGARIIGYSDEIKHYMLELERNIFNNNFYLFQKYL